MKYLCAYALAWLGGKKEPSVNDLKDIIESTGGDFDHDRAQDLVGRLKGKDLSQVIQEGLPKLQSVAAVAGGGGVAQAAETTDAPVEEPPAEEEEDEDAMEGAMDLFGGDDDW